MKQLIINKSLWLISYLVSSAASVCTKPSDSLSTTTATSTLNLELQYDSADGNIAKGYDFYLSTFFTNNCAGSLNWVDICKHVVLIELADGSSNTNIQD